MNSRSCSWTSLSPPDVVSHRICLLLSFLYSGQKLHGLVHRVNSQRLEERPVHTRHSVNILDSTAEGGSERGGGGGAQEEGPRPEGPTLRSVLFGAGTLVSCVRPGFRASDLSRDPFLKHCFLGYVQKAARLVRVGGRAAPADENSPHSVAGSPENVSSCRRRPSG